MWPFAINIGKAGPDELPSVLLQERDRVPIMGCSSSIEECTLTSDREKLDLSAIHDVESMGSSPWLPRHAYWGVSYRRRGDYVVGCADRTEWYSLSPSVGHYDSDERGTLILVVLGDIKKGEHADGSKGRELCPNSAPASMCFTAMADS